MGPQAGVVLHVTGQVVMQQGRHRDHAPADHRPATTRRTPLAPAIYHAQRRRAAEPERRVPSSDTTAGAMAAMVALVSSPGRGHAVESFTCLPDRMLLVDAADVIIATRAASGARS